MRGGFWGLMALAGCAQGPAELPNETDEPIEDSGDLSCEDRLFQTQPYDGFGAWYWRDVPGGLVERADPEAYSVALLGPDEALVTERVVWQGEGLRFSLVLDAPLQPATDYRLTVQDCAELHEIDFRTSALGEPLLDAPQELVDRTFHLDLQGANWIEPGGVSGLLQLYFNTPILLGVIQADEEHLTFMGAPGRVGPLIGMVQDKSMATWPFAPADFSEAPYFSTEGGLIVLDIDGVDVPIEQFSFQGTLSADATRFGGVVIRGLVDTRYLGELLQQPNEPAALCNLAEGVGVDCVPCGDGEPYCLTMHARDTKATWVQDLVLEPVD